MFTKSNLDTSYLCEVPSKPCREDENKRQSPIAEEAKQLFHLLHIGIQLIMCESEGKC